MKKILLACLSLSLMSFAANAAPVAKPIKTKIVEPGSYTGVDVETGDIHAQLVIRADKTLNFKVQTPDFEMPEPGCEGTYDVQGNNFTSQLTCPLSILPEVSVNIDISNITPESVRSAEGALVPVVIDALGTDPMMVRLKIVE